MWTLVPMMFYDFIGRIIPGMTALIIIICVIYTPSFVLESTFINPTNLDLFGIGQITLLMLGSYLIGLLLGQFFDSTLGSFKFVKSKKEKIAQHNALELFTEHFQLQETLGRNETQLKYENMPNPFVMYSHLTHMAPSKSPQLLKLHAEQRVCQVLIIGVLISLLINALYLFSQVTEERIILEIILILSLPPLWIRFIKSYELFVKDTVISWLIHTSAEKIE